MQLFWVSGAVGQIKTINLTFRTLVIGLLVFALFLIILGSALQFFGFRMAVEYDPAIARKLGNLHTAVELEHLHALYEAKLNDVNTQLEINRAKIKELDDLNRKLALIATPATIKKEKLLSSGVGGQYLPLVTTKSKSTLAQLSHVSKNIKMLNNQIDQSLDQTTDYLNWLKSKPIIAPIHGPLSLASVFGARIDPFRFTPSFHAGLDFSSGQGTPFYATAKGKVIEAGWHEGYGNQVLIDHGGGYKTRYAHANKLYVKKGMVVEQNTLLGAIGSTGRSTGPHLHYEVIKSGVKIDPADMLLGL
jgi:murein DD-endopeptidase MepM/ murein hydrolase activator NlpD